MSWCGCWINEISVLKSQRLILNVKFKHFYNQPVEIPAQNQHPTKQCVTLSLLAGPTWVIPTTWPKMGTSWRQSHCHVCEAAARHGRGPPCWPPAPSAGPRVRRRWLSGSLRPHCGSSTSSPARWCWAGRHLKETGRGHCSLWCYVFHLADVFPVWRPTSLNSSIPGQAAMRLDAGHKDW